MRILNLVLAMVNDFEFIDIGGITYIVWPTSHNLREVSDYSLLKGIKPILARSSLSRCCYN